MYTILWIIDLTLFYYIWQDQYRFCYKALWDFINMRLPGGMLTEQMSKTRSDRMYNSLSLNSYTSEHMPYWETKHVTVYWNLPVRLNQC